MKRLYNHYFPTPSYLAMNAFAVDISDKSIKYGELVMTTAGLRLGKYGKEKIPEGTVVSGKIEKENELINSLKKIKEREKNFRFIRVSLSEEQMYLFTLSIPKSDETNIRDTILLQIEEYVPLKALDVAFDFDIIEEDEKNVSVEVVAIASTTLESYLSVFEKSGLVPLSFEIDAQATARAIIEDGDNSSVMIVDFGDFRTGISVSSKGRIFLTTTLSLGGIDLTNMIAKNFNFSFEEAEKMKQEYGLNKVSKAGDIFPAIINGISVLKDEINKQYQYWETHYSNNGHESIKRIILCGGDANLAGLSEYLELSMKIKVENANVWVNILNTENYIPEMSFEESLGYATVFGLALGGYKNNLQPVINILPDKEKKTLHQNYWIRFSTMILHLLALSGVIAILLLFPSYFISRLEERLVENRLESFNIDNPDLSNNNINNIINSINSKLEMLNKSKGTYEVNSKILDNILANRTSGITFSQILFNKKSVDSSLLEIHGFATNRDALRNFKTKLDDNPDFIKVDLPVSNFLEKANLPFTISITLK